MKITEYDLSSVKRLGLRVAHLSDTHGMRPEKLIDKVKGMAPDLILLSGDIFEYLAKDPELEKKKNRNALELLVSLAKIAPTYFSVGNHDNGGAGAEFLLSNKTVKRDFTLPESFLAKVRESGAVLLDNSAESFEWGDKKILLGGQTSGIAHPDRQPHLEWLESFNSAEGYDAKILLCHHPEYAVNYREMICGDADFVLSGHAHGGQIWFFGRGLYAPCQGFFAKYVKGVHKVEKSRLVISRGLKNTHPLIPRFFNPCEAISILL